MQYWWILLLLLLLSNEGQCGNPWDSIAALKDKSADEVKDILHLFAERSVRNKEVKFGSGVHDIDTDIMLGVMYMNAGLVSESIALNEKLIRAHPHVVAPYVALGTLYAEQKQFSKAISLFTQGIEASPAPIAELYQRRCQVYMGLGKYMDALADITTAMQINMDIDSIYTRGTIYMHLKNPTRAALDAQAVLQVSPNHTHALQLLGMAMYETGNCDEAIKAYEKTLSQNTVMTAFRIGTAYKELSNYSKSVEYFTLTEKLDPSFAATYQYRGQAHYSAGEISHAIDDFTRCVEHAPSLEKCRRLLGVAHHSRGEYTKALTHYDMLIAGEQGLPWYLKVIAQYQQTHLDTSVRAMENEMWDSLGKHFFRGFFDISKGTVASTEFHFTMPTFTSTHYAITLADVAPTYLASFPTPTQALLRVASELGKAVQVRAPGFSANKRQFRAMGLAIIEIAQWVRNLWKTGNYENTDYRQLYNIATKWRQYSEPNDAVFWVDDLVVSEWDEDAGTTNAENNSRQLGLGLSTPIVNGHVKQVRYYAYFKKIFEVMKTEMDKKYNDKTMTIILKYSSTLQEVYSLVQAPFWVMTKVKSTAEPGKTLDGTRIFLQAADFEGFDLMIQTICVKQRWADYEAELNFLWKEFLEEGAKAQPDLNRIHEIVLSMTFYWYTFMPLTRGSAVVGHATMLGLLYSVGEILTDLLPQSMLPDWEAFVVSSPEEFVAVMKPVLEGIIGKANEHPSIFGENAVEVSTTFGTLRQMIQAMNYSDRETHLR